MGYIHCMVYISWAPTSHNQSRDSESESKICRWGKHSRLHIKPGQPAISIHVFHPCLPTISLLKPSKTPNYSKITRTHRKNTHTHTLRKEKTRSWDAQTVPRHCSSKPHFEAQVFLVKVQTNLQMESYWKTRGVPQPVLLQKYLRNMYCTIYLYQIKSYTNIIHKILLQCISYIYNIAGG